MIVKIASDNKVNMEKDAEITLYISGGFWL